MKTLAILIATTIDRRPMFDILMEEFERQIQACKLEYCVKVYYLEDNKEISVGLKRQKLLNMSDGHDYIVFFDSDDMPHENYVKKLHEAIQLSPDCVGFEIDMTTNGTKPQKCCHSLKYPVWQEMKDGYDYVRNITHFNPVKRELAVQVGFKDMRFGEDKDYADRLTPLCKKEIFINEPLFHYRFNNQLLNHNKKYGIR